MYQPQGLRGPVEVSLEIDYFLRAKRVAQLRRESGIANNRKGRNGFPTDEAEIDRREMLGAFGEAVMAQYFNLPPSCLKTERPDKNHEPDVGGVGVRACERDYAHLIIHKKEWPTKPMVLVTGRLNQTKFVIRGWLYAQDAKRKEWLKTVESTSYWAPQRALRHISTLPGKYRNDCRDQPVDLADRRGQPRRA